VENVASAMESTEHPGHGEQNAAGEIADHARATTALRLLLVEDDPADARLTQALLGQAGVAAQWSRAGKLADISFGAAGEWADCALVDLGLPGSQGLGAVREILRRAPRLPVVVLSGNGDQVLALRAVREGAQDYLVKGRTDAGLLAKTIRYAIERKKIEHELQQTQQLARLGRLAGRITHHFNNSCRAGVAA
jgi:DNA-binding response OmpR family regulator